MIFFLDHLAVNGADSLCLSLWKNVFSKLDLFMLWCLYIFLALCYLSERKGPFHTKYEQSKGTFLYKTLHALIVLFDQPEESYT